MHTRGERIGAALAALAVLGAAAVYAVAVQLAGGSGLGMLLYWLCFAVCVLLPGLFLVNTLAPGLGAAGSLAAAGVFGTGLLMLSFAVFGLLGVPFLSVLPGGALGLYWLWRRRGAVRGLPGRFVSTSGWAKLLVALIAALVLVNAFAAVLTTAKPHVYGNYFYSQDMVWSVGNAASVQWGFPLRDIRSVSGVMHYHYLSDATAGLLALVTGQSAWDAVCYFVWPLWMPLLLCALYALARRLGAGPGAALLLPLSASLLHARLYESYYHFFFNPNGVVQSYLFLAVCILLLLCAEATGFAGRRLLVAFSLAVFVLVWGKGTSGALLLLGIAAASLVYCVARRRVNRNLLVYVGCGFAVFLLVFALILSGGMTHVQTGGTAAHWRRVLGYILQMWPLCALYLPLAVYALCRLKTISLTVLSLHATIVGGVLAAGLFNHYGSSQYYFLFTSFFLMWICVVEGLVQLAARPLRRVVQGAVAVLAAVSLFPFAPALARTALGGAGTARYVLAGGEQPLFGYSVFTISASDEAAALWLRDTMAPGEVFATNRQHRMENGNDGVFHFYSAVSERQCYMEGWQYAVDYSTSYEDMIYQSSTVSDYMFGDVPYDETLRVAREHGIDYLVLHLANRHDRPFDAEPVFTSPDVLIYRVE